VLKAGALKGELGELGREPEHGGEQEGVQLETAFEAGPLLRRQDLFRLGDWGVRDSVVRRVCGCLF